jgi:hypothetical protein
MTNAELIEALKKLPLDLEVVVPVRGIFIAITEPRVVKALNQDVIVL